MTTRSACKIKQSALNQESVLGLPLGCYAALVDCWVYVLWCEWALLEGSCSVNSVVVDAAAAAVVACSVFVAAPVAAFGIVSLPAMSSAGPARKFIIMCNTVSALTTPARLIVFPHHEQSLLVNESLLLFSQLLGVDGWRAGGHSGLWHCAWHHHSYVKKARM